jgi:hypothetical protein
LFGWLFFHSPGCTVTPVCDLAAVGPATVLSPMGGLAVTEELRYTIEIFPVGEETCFSYFLFRFEFDYSICFIRRNGLDVVFSRSDAVRNLILPRCPWYYPGLLRQVRIAKESFAFVSLDLQKVFNRFDWTVLFDCFYLLSYVFFLVQIE